jgi:ubiquitin carboxyl-terminal hydrolase 10
MPFLSHLSSASPYQLQIHRHLFQYLLVELLTLLITGPKAPFSPPKILPCGFINTGNMCFVNAVLQILIYCPPFYQLFTELGKYLTGPIVGAQKEGGKATPLIDATIDFLKELKPVPAHSKTKGKEVGREEVELFIPTESDICT